MTRTPLLLLMIAAPLLAACAPKLGQDLPPFGASVRHAKEVQTYHPGESQVPALHGDRATRNMEAYRGVGGQGAEIPPAPMR